MGLALERPTSAVKAVTRTLSFIIGDYEYSKWNMVDASKPGRAELRSTEYQFIVAWHHVFGGCFAVYALE
jgi:hypothetical protein